MDGEELGETALAVDGLTYVPLVPLLEELGGCTAVWNAEKSVALADTPLFQLPEEVQTALMREQVEKLPLTGNSPYERVICYCNRCVKGITAGGGTAVHLLELAMGTFSGH